MELTTRQRREVRRTLEQTRALIARPYGWIKGRNFGVRRGVDCYCLNGAIVALTGAGVHRARTRGVLAETIGNDRVGEFGIVSFNDASDTRKRDVLAALDKAIAGLSA